MEVSIIVPVYNGAPTIRQCLDSILALGFPRDRFELICVDNASTDATPAILRDFRESAQVIRETRRGAAAARNAGLRAAGGKWVAFTDADCTVDPGWLDYLLAPLRNGHADAVGGRILARPLAGLVERFGDRVHDHRAAIERSWPPYLITMNLAMPLALLERHGGFDERWLRSQDSELSFRLTCAGCRFAYAPEAIVRHYHRSTVSALCREGFIHGYYGAELYRIYAELDARPNSVARESEDSPALSWQDTLLRRLFRTAKQVGWALGKRYPPRSLRSPIPVLMDRDSAR
jgi:glycosyltransferase involved in cell wall biosynthesis